MHAYYKPGGKGRMSAGFSRSSGSSSMYSRLWKTRSSSLSGTFGGRGTAGNGDNILRGGLTGGNGDREVLDLNFEGEEYAASSSLDGD